ncbi:hypothetical protein GTP56_05430 [Duganella sp. FT134W]|uniref:Uncharacterized protein n=1 Tax=Duganella margarita TaxID=2692170 RepID=A0A7X4GXQ2_9BURK|nr:HAD domain-containing protein [Duganella margarita]MYM71637.1 hypothetical protein [Duganella margarita]
MSPLLFLDFDDVLAIDPQYPSGRVLTALLRGKLDEVPELWENIFDKLARQNLLMLHEEFSPTYVISSSWAGMLSREQICEVLRRTKMQFVANDMHDEWKLPHLKVPERAADIEAWLHLHNQVSPRPFLILDDVISGHPIRNTRLEQYAVLCDAWSGFTDKNLEHAQMILRAQMNPTSPNNA